MHLRSSRSASRQLRRPISSGSLFQSTIFIVDDLGDPKMARTLKRKVPHFFRTVYLLHPYAPISFCRWLHGVEWGLSLYSLKPSHHVFWGPHWGTIKWTFHWPSSGSARITTLWATIVVTWNPGIFLRSCCVGTFKTSRC